MNALGRGKTVNWPLFVDIFLDNYSGSVFHIFSLQKYIKMEGIVIHILFWWRRRQIWELDPYFERICGALNNLHQQSMIDTEY